MMLAASRFGFLSTVLFLTACVTVNIYFPAAAAEEAARSIVRDVLGKEMQDQKPAEEAPAEEAAPDQSSALPPTHAARLAAAVAWLTASPAHAADVDIDISSPAINRLRSSMRARQSQLAPFYRSGAIGFTRDALVGVRDIGQVSLRDRNRLKQLVADENQDRNALYREIARANGHPEWEADIRDTFARVWIEEAPGGYWYQDASGNWRQK